jgi:NAD(P)-dependent dehydrogenase (short-subunit alcohol dehydrogenase family)
MDVQKYGRRFEGRVAVVTGASTDPGIGTASARRLAAEGASVVINARHEDRLRATEKALQAEGLTVIAVPGAADDEAMPARLVDAALREFGRIDLLANTVGGAPFPSAPLTLDRAALLDTVALNTWPALSLIQEAMRRGLADGGGAVVNISSGSPNKTTPVMIAYAAAKAALNTMTRTLANDLGRQGVRVNAVAPGLTKTVGTESMWLEDEGRAAGSNLLLGRMTEADDIAAAVAFLLSDDARAITGVIIDVDSGNHVSSGGWSPFSPSAIGKPGGAPVDRIAAADRPGQ